MSGAHPLSSDLTGAGLAAYSSLPALVASSAEQIVSTAIRNDPPVQATISTSAAGPAHTSSFLNPITSHPGGTPGISQADLILPSAAISVAPPHVSSLSVGSFRGGLDGVLTVAAISTASPLITSTGLEIPAESGTIQQLISSLRVLTIDIQASGQSSLSSLITATPRATFTSSASAPAATSTPVSPSIVPTSTALSPPVRTPSSSADIQLMAMESAPPQAANIFNPDNKLFPLGITAVSIAGIFIAIIATFLVIRLTGCTKRRRFNKRQPIPSFVDSTDGSSSFHDRSLYHDQLPYRDAKFVRDIEAGALGTGGVQSQMRQLGWDTNQAPPPVRGLGIASTSLADQDAYGTASGSGIRAGEQTRTKLAKRYNEQSLTVYEQAFFPSTFYPSSTSRELTGNKRSSGSSFGSTIQLGDNPIPSFGTGRGIVPDTDNDTGTPTVNPFIPSTGATRPALVLTNPDLSRQTTPIPRYSDSPARPIQGFQPQSRSRPLSISSSTSTTSSASVYSQMTRAMPFVLSVPRPPFALEQRARGRVESLDVPKDAVSRRGSETSG